VSPALIGHVDFFASLADLTGGKPAAVVAPDSMDMLPAMLGRDQKGREWLVEHAGSLGLIEGSWKFIAPGNGPKINRNTNTEMGNDPQPQLYDLSTDIAEQHNVAAEHPDRVKAMAEHLQRIRAAAR
jgi:hypothetical protein